MEISRFCCVDRVAIAGFGGYRSRIVPLGFAGSGQATVEERMSEAVSSKKKPLFLGGLFALVLVGVLLVVGWQQAIWPLNQASERALTRRAQYFWDMKTSGDSLGAYNMMAESFRRRVTPAGFSRQGAGLVIHTGVDIQEVEIDEDEGVALVSGELRYRFNKKAFVDEEVSAGLQERWIFENGAWYRWPVGARG